MKSRFRPLLAVIFTLALLLVFLNGCGPAASPAPQLPLPREETLHLLSAQRPAARDWVRLGREYRGIQAVTAPPAAPKAYQIGDQETFWVGRNIFAGTYERVPFTLGCKNDVAYLWVENGVTWKGHAAIRAADLQALADLFTSRIYPLGRRLLGRDPDTSPDNDPHLYLLFTRSEGLGAYFDASDDLPPEVVYHSNLHKMIYVNAPSYSPAPGSVDFLSMALAHEFTHLIHFDGNQYGEAGWIGEGLANLGVELDGFRPTEDNEFAAHPAIQLNRLMQYPPDLWRAHYGAAHLFLSYLYTRFGDDFIRDIVSTGTSGIPTIQRALDRNAAGLQFDAVFADWAAADLLANRSAEPRYRVSDFLFENLSAFQVAKSLSGYPARAERTVSQYGSDYIELLPAGREVTFTFDGTQTVGAIPVQAHGGRFMWWGGRNVGDARLTRSVDLQGVVRATLKFAAWYDLYENWDFAYASVSTDGGATWKTLQGVTTTDRNPSALNLGNGFTCKSGIGCGKPGKTARWVEETMDLTPYAGKVIQLRFEQVSGDQSDGLALDDIEIPEIGFHDDAETAAGGWQAEGFVRMDNLLPQHFVLQAVEFRSTPRVVAVPLDDQNHASYRTSGFGRDLQRVIMVVSGSTPVTGETAGYTYVVR
jgi:immune inhibitor A